MEINKDMREIKFRGLSTDGKGWVYGFYYEYNGKPIISSEDHSDDCDTYHNDEVIRESVGQFTGIKDKNGVDIYEGDKVTYKNGTCTPVLIVHEGRSLTAYESNYSESYIVFYNGCFALHNEHDTKNHEINSKYNRTSYSGEINRYHGFEYEVIGNIHEKK